MKKETLQKTGIVSLIAMLCCFLWGSAFPVIKVGYRLLQIGGNDTATQILFAGCRFFMAGFFVILFGSLLQRKVLLPKKSTGSKIFKLSLVQTVMQYIFFYIGVAHTTGVKGSVVVSSSVFITILLSGLVFRLEKLTLQKIVGCIVGFAGVILVNLSGMSFHFNLAGDGSIFMSAVAYALSSILIKRYSEGENPVVLSGYQFLLGGFLMAVGGFVFGGRIHVFPAAGVAIWVYTAIISAVAYTLWGILLKYNPVSKVSIFGFMTPIFGVLLSAIILREGNSFGVRGVIALLLVCAGIIAVNASQKSSASLKRPE